MNRCHIYLWISNRWLSFRMQVLGAAVAGLVGLAGEGHIVSFVEVAVGKMCGATLTLFCLYAVVLETGSIGSTVAGIVLIYSLSFCEALTFLARAHADVSCHADCHPYSL